jgi:SNF2 family DNA or RNA helicase
LNERGCDADRGLTTCWERGRQSFGVEVPARPEGNEVTHMIPPLFAHQVTTVAKAQGCLGFFDMSDPGTGKTRAHLHDFARAGGRLLVLAPKSVLQPAWGNDIEKFFPGMTYAIANANNRAKAFALGTDVVITNHDAATWLIKNPQVLEGFDRFIVDESTAYKNPQAQRSKAMLKLAKQFKWKRVMSGTPNPNSILELFHQVLLIDGGERLGDNFYKFRKASTLPFQNGPRPEHVEWRDKPGIEAAVFGLLADISIRHKFEECVSIPPNHVTRVEFELSPACRRQYDQMLDHAVLMLSETQVVRGINAAAVATKLLQIASGAMYTGEEGKYVTLDEGRIELVMELLEPRKHSLVAFQWKHQRDQLVAAATARGYSFAVLDGEMNAADRAKVVEAFQGGRLKVLFAHPQSAAHGLTLTRGTTTIWASPTHRSDLWKQFNARIHRVGQEERTETILIAARNTRDERAYDGLAKKLSSMELLLSLMEAA